MNKQEIFHGDFPDRSGEIAGQEWGNCLTGVWEMVGQEWGNCRTGVGKLPDRGVKKVCILHKLLYNNDHTLHTFFTLYSIKQIYDRNGDSTCFSPLLSFLLCTQLVRKSGDRVIRRFWFSGVLPNNPRA